MGEPGIVDIVQPDRLVALAIERAYDAFAHDRLGPSMTMHRGDVTPQEVADLAGPLRQVTATAIDRWLPHATTTWGDAADLRALLPRVLELFAQGQLSTPPEVFFAKLHQDGAGRWTMAEQAAVEDVVTAMWLATLASHPPSTGLPAWRLLVAMAELGGDLSPFLDDWLLLLASGTTEARAARRHLRDLTRRLQGLTDAGLGVSALFWSSRPQEVQRLERWLATSFMQGQAGR